MSDDQTNPQGVPETGQREPIEDGRKRTSGQNGKLFGGREPFGQTYEAAELADAVAESILKGDKSVLTLRKTRPMSDGDRQVLSRMTGMTAEKFIETVSAKLQVIAHKTADRIAEKLEGDDCKLSDLNMTLAISVDKLQAMSGRVSQMGNVNIQINQSFGDAKAPRESVLSNLAALRGGKPVEPILEAQTG